jgi:UDP-glucose 4-epimerase
MSQNNSRQAEPIAKQLVGEKVLVTGGAGFIGSHLVDRLLREGADVVVVDNLSRGRRENLSAAAAFAWESNVALRFVEGDIRFGYALDKLMQDHHFSYVYHLAAIRINQCAQEPKEAKEVLIDGTLNVLQASVKYNIRKVIVASSASIYGLADAFPTGETHHPYNDQTLYGAFKCCNEGMARAFAAMYNLRYICLRFFNVYGPRMDIHGKYTEVILKWLDAIDAGKPPVIFGTGHETLDFVYVKDVIAALINAVTVRSALNLTVNIGSGIETSLWNLAWLLIKLRKADLQPITELDLPTTAVARRQADIREVAQLLDWYPSTNLEDGLRELIEWRAKEIQRDES